MTNGHTSPPLLKLAELPLMKVSANDVAPARECIAQRKFVGHFVERAHAVFDDAGVARVFAQLIDELAPRVDGSVTTHVPPPAV